MAASIRSALQRILPSNRRAEPAPVPSVDPDVLRMFAADALDAYQKAKGSGYSFTILANPLTQGAPDSWQDATLREGIYEFHWQTGPTTKRPY